MWTWLGGLAGWRYGVLGAAQVAPIDVRPKLFARDFPAGLPLDVDRQAFAACPAIGNVSQLPDSRAAARRELRAILFRKR